MKGAFVKCTQFVILLFAVMHFSSAFPMTEDGKIRALLEALGSSNLIFIRNDVEYPAVQAKSHLEMKLSRAGSRIRTADDFIRYLATKSSATGRPYYVKLPDGNKIESAVWLRKKLAEIESSGR